MTINATKRTYTSKDSSIPISQTAVTYPVCAFLEKCLNYGDEVKAVLLVKQDEYGQYIKNANVCIEELAQVSRITGATIDYKIIETEFVEEQAIHDKLLLSIVDELEENTHIIADITYGPKDLPIVLFTAMNFGEKYLGCEIDSILYGQAVFMKDRIVETRICDMIPLYYLNSVATTVQCSSPEDAKRLLKTLLSI